MGRKLERLISKHPHIHPVGNPMTIIKNQIQRLQKKKSELENSIGVLLITAQGDSSVISSIEQLETELAAVEAELKDYLER